jgi:uncharacterized iron-regulated membrane protein
LAWLPHAPPLATFLNPDPAGDRLSVAASACDGMRVSVDSETGATLLAGMGELHLNIVVETLKEDPRAALHFGDYVGMPLKIIWAILDIVTIIILVTGLFLWLKRYRSAASVSRFVRLNEASIGSKVPS